jgi:hypothetical protein
MVRWYAEPGTRRQRRGLDADPARARRLRHSGLAAAQSREARLRPAQRVGDSQPAGPSTTTYTQW